MKAPLWDTTIRTEHDKLSTQVPRVVREGSTKLDGALNHFRRYIEDVLDAYKRDLMLHQEEKGIVGAEEMTVEPGRGVEADGNMETMDEKESPGKMKTGWVSIQPTPVSCWMSSTDPGMSKKPGSFLLP